MRVCLLRPRGSTVEARGRAILRTALNQMKPNLASPAGPRLGASSDLQPGKLLPPAVVGCLVHADRPYRVCHALSLRNQYIDLAQLCDNPFRFVSLPCHRSPPRCEKAKHQVGPIQWGWINRSEQLPYWIMFERPPSLRGRVQRADADESCAAPASGRTAAWPPHRLLPP